MGYVLARGVGVENLLLMVIRQLVLVAVAGEFRRGIDEQSFVVVLGFFQHDDAGGDGGAEEQVWRQLDDCINVVVVDQVLADFLLCAAAIEYAGKFNNRRRAVHRQPAQNVHGEGEVGLALGGEHTGRRKARVVDEQRIGIAIPADRIRRIGDDGLEGFVIPVRGVGECVAVGDVELFVIYVVQEHVDPAQVEGGEVNFLPVEALPHVVVAQYLGEFEQQRARAAGGVIHLVDLGLANHGDAGEQFGNFLRGVKLTARFARCRGVHLHQIFVGITEEVDGIVGKVAGCAAQGQVADGFEQLHQLFVALGHRGAELVAVDIQVVEQSFDVVLAIRADGGAFDVLEHAGEGFIEIGIVARLLTNIGEQVRWKDVETFFLHCFDTPEFGIGITERGIFEIRDACLAFLLVQVGGEVLRDKTVEQHAKHVGFKVPSVHAAAQVVGNTPYCFVEFRAFGFFIVIHDSNL